MPWKIGQILLRGISKIDEFVVRLEQHNLKFADEIKGFDPNHLFIDHMTSIGYNTSLTNTFLFEEEEGDSQDPPIPVGERKTKDIETIVSTVDKHKQRGQVANERSTHSPSISHKNNLPKQISQPMTPQKKKSSTNNSDDGGDQNPSRGNLETSNKLQVKRKM
jgi:hypothetical protein